jgi:hypothetical protein
MPSYEGLGLIEIPDVFGLNEITLNEVPITVTIVCVLCTFHLVYQNSLT